MKSIRHRVASIVDHEPVHEKGKPFSPDTRQKKILTEAAFVGEAMAQTNTFDKRFEGSSYRPPTQWHYVITLNPSQEAADYSQLDERAAYFYEGVLLTNAMISSTPGVGQAYLGTYRGKDGHPFDGAKTYRLRVPPNLPAK